MTKISACVNPISMKEVERLRKEFHLSVFNDPVKIERMNQLKPYLMDIEPLSLCAGSCKSCISSSDTSTNIMMTKEKVFELLEDSYELGTRSVTFVGGDPLLHPSWEEFICYASDKGMVTFLTTSGLISKGQAKRIARLIDRISSVGFHLDTINQEAYNDSHYEPKTMELKKQGLYNLLEAGIPLEKVTVCITLTDPAARTIEETLDWYVDEMGLKEIIILQNKPEGFSKLYPELEADLSEIRRALLYRAKKLGKHWLRFGSGDADKFLCRTIFGITYTGDVLPCRGINQPVGNIYKEPLKDIMDRARDTLFYNFEVEGFCKECENSDVCWGCRAIAAHYTGNVRASDPKCFMNPDAKEYYLK